MSQFSPFTPTISSSEMPLPLISAYDNPTYDPRPSLKASSSREPPKIPHLEVASPSSEKAGPFISPSLKWHLYFLSMLLLPQSGCQLRESCLYFLTKMSLNAFNFPAWGSPIISNLGNLTQPLHHVCYLIFSFLSLLT